MERLNYEKVTNEVLDEILRAKNLHPKNFNSAHEGYSIILEEIDELWDEIKKNSKNRDMEAMRMEAIQSAAMCVRFVTELFEEK